MTYRYDNEHYNPPAPVLPITVYVPDDSTKQVKTEALVDTGADMTCLPRALINALNAQPASSYNVRCINEVSIGLVDSYFLEFEIAGEKKMVEVIAVDDERILGRNLINEFMLQLHGPGQKLDIGSGVE